MRVHTCLPLEKDGVRRCRLADLFYVVFTSRVIGVIKQMRWLSMGGLAKVQGKMQDVERRR